jgi:hypothetical protein
LAQLGQPTWAWPKRFGLNQSSRPTSLARPPSLSRNPNDPNWRSRGDCVAAMVVVVLWLTPAKLGYAVGRYRSSTALAGARISQTPTDPWRSSSICATSPRVDARRLPRSRCVVWHGPGRGLAPPWLVVPPCRHVCLHDSPGNLLLFFSIPSTCCSLCVCCRCYAAVLLFLLC